MSVWQKEGGRGLTGCVTHGGEADCEVLEGGADYNAQVVGSLRDVKWAFAHLSEDGGGGIDTDLRTRAVLMWRTRDFAKDVRTGEDDSAPEWKILMSSRPESASSLSSPRPYPCDTQCASLPISSVCAL